MDSSRKLSSELCSSVMRNDKDGEATINTKVVVGSLTVSDLYASGLYYIIHSQLFQKLRQSRSDKVFYRHSKHASRGLTSYKLPNKKKSTKTYPASTFYNQIT